MTDRMKAGTYDAFFPNGGRLKHAFAGIERAGGGKQWFDCAGGHSAGAAKHYKFPVKLYKKRAGHFLKKTNVTSPKADLAWARKIAGWGSSNQKVIQKSHTGLTYLIDGVCHQMCNSVLYTAEHPKGYRYGYISPAIIERIGTLAVSTWAAFGYYGTGVFGRKDDKRMAKFDSMKNSNAKETPFEYALETTRERLAEIFEPAFVRPQLLENFGLDENDPRIDAALISLEKTFHRRRDLEIQLLKGEITSQDLAAREANKLFAEDGVSLSLLLPEEEPSELMSTIEGEDGNLANPDSIDLEQLKSLGDRMDL